MMNCLKIFLTVLSAAWLVGFTQTQSSKDVDETTIRSAVQVLQEAYNQQDGTKLSTLWTSDATYNNPVTGDFAEGREAIEKLFKEKFSQDKKRHLEITIKDIEFSNADEALERGIMKVTSSDQTTQQAAFQLRFAKENGKWLISDFNEIELKNAPSNFEKLKELDWLVGKWEDSDDNVQILFDNQWDKYKNFLTENFKMSIYGQDDIEGKQIIAWDPINESIRSWVFDSDGGFGEGKWEKIDKSWHATMQFTLSDGRTASSTNIYTPVDDHSYTFSSVERQIDDEILPDLDPVTVEKIN